jgi:cysteine synthase B
MRNSYYLDRWNKWPLPILSVPSALNPLEADQVDLSIALAYHLPYESIKFLTVYGLLSGAEESGVLNGVHTLIEATSGNAGVVLAPMARSWGIARIKLVVAPDLPDGKRYPLLMSGAEVIPPEEGLSGIATARKLGGGGWRSQGWHADNGCLNLDQYANPDGTKLHTSFTAPKILEQLSCPPTVFVAGIGTGGTLVGISNYLRNNLEKVKIGGVLLSPGQEIPGVRDLNRMKEITLPWRESLDEQIEMETKPSYLAALWFNWLMGITPGPSSGLAYLGALKLLKEYKDKKDGRDIDSLRDRQGRIHAVTLFPDGNRPYGDRFTANLPFEYFRASTAPLPWKFPGHELW